LNESGSNSNTVEWWGSYDLKERHVAEFCIGPGRVALYRDPEEWRLLHESGSDHMALDASVSFTSIRDSPELQAAFSEGERLRRYSFHMTDGEFEVRPALADRAVVVRPESPLFVSAGETVTLYISTPVWFAVFVGNSPRALVDVPLFRPSDTWFGPSTISGELCYNTKTKARLTLDAVPRRPHRAITAVVIENRAEEELFLERLRLPVTHLALFSDGDGNLWTDSVTLEKSRGDDTATMSISKRPHGVPQLGPRVSDPRDPVRTSILIRPFNMLFHRVDEV